KHLQLFQLCKLCSDQLFCCLLQWWLLLATVSFAIGVLVGCRLAFGLALSVACCGGVGCGETCSPSGHAAHLRLRLLLFRLAAARAAATTAVPGHLPHFVIVTHARFV
ncbi:unnamed protein product, partial [Ectocarpus sp. 8 AP-2014]